MTIEYRGHGPINRDRVRGRKEPCEGGLLILSTRRVLRDVEQTVGRVDFVPRPQNHRL